MKPRRTDSTDRNPAQYSKSICQCKFMKRHRAIEIFRRQIREKEQTLQLCKYSPVLWLTFDKAKSCSLHIICYFPPSSQEHQANNATPESHLSEKEITWRTRAEQTIVSHSSSSSLFWGFSLLVQSEVHRAFALQL